MRIHPFFRMAWVFTAAFLLIGAVAKKQDPIVNTQADPIDYREKQKEEKEGKKGPPMPTVDFFPRARFLTEGPASKTKETPLPKESQDAELWFEEDTEEPAGEEDEFKLALEKDDIWEDSNDEKKAVS